jgi:transposase-like protein
MKLLQKTNGEIFHQWLAVDHEDHVLDCYVMKRRSKAVAKGFLIKNAQAWISKGYHDQKIAIMWRRFSLNLCC